MRRWNFVVAHSIKMKPPRTETPRRHMWSKRKPQARGGRRPLTVQHPLLHLHDWRVESRAGSVMAQRLVGAFNVAVVFLINSCEIAGYFIYEGSVSSNQRAHMKQGNHFTLSLRNHAAPTQSARRGPCAVLVVVVLPAAGHAVERRAYLHLRMLHDTHGALRRCRNMHNILLYLPPSECRG